LIPDWAYFHCPGTTLLMDTTLNVVLLVLPSEPVSLVLVESSGAIQNVLVGFFGGSLCISFLFTSAVLQIVFPSKEEMAFLGWGLLMPQGFFCQCSKMIIPQLFIPATSHGFH